MNVYLADRKVPLSPSKRLGSGGEADVYDVGGGRALKHFKAPDHPDVRDVPALRDAAAQRLDEHQHKLARFPRTLPPRVIAPEELATDRPNGGRVVGYAMALVAAAEPLVRYSEPAFRRAGVDANDVVAVLRDLRITVGALHRAGVVIGDFNDLNVLVRDRSAFVIDADSFQFGPYRSGLYTERFVDPRLCDPSLGAPMPTRPHDEGSDWYAFSVLLMRSLLCVGPYGGVHRPSDPARRVPHAARPLHRITLFRSDVILPRAALPPSVLPDELASYLREVFERDLRGPFPEALLDRLRFARCARCDLEHARATCPACAFTPPKPHATVRGHLTVERILEGAGVVVEARIVDGELRWITWQDGALRDGAGRTLAETDLVPDLRVRVTREGCLVGRAGRARLVRRLGPIETLLVDQHANETLFDANAAHHYWLEGGQLVRDGRHGPTRIGEVLAGQARFWVGERFGVGFYRTGALDVTFTFDAERPGLADRVDLCIARGALLAAHAAVGAEHAWLFTLERRDGRERHRCRMLDRRGAELASAEDASGEETWLASGAGACAVGAMLFVPTDAGVVRVEADGPSLHATKTFADTAPFVDATTRLYAGRGGLYAVGTDRIDRLRVA